MPDVHGSFAAVSRGMGKVGQNSSCLMGRRTFPLSFWGFFCQCVFSPLVKETKRRCWGGRGD